MYHFLDRPVTTLDAGGRFLIWAMRSWVKVMGERSCPGTAIAYAFGRWNVIAGLQPFLRIMALFNRHGLETFQFCALQCNHVSEHEAILLSLVCDLRDAEPQAIRDTLAMLIEEDQIGELIAALTVLGRSLERGGILPRRGAWLPQPLRPAPTRGQTRQ